MAKDNNAADANARKHIDPRYDPVFQRGYRAEARTSGRSESAQRERRRVERPKREDAAVADAPTVRRERPDPYPEMPAIHSAVDPEQVDSGVDEFSGDVEDDLERPTVPPARFNPYIVALWVIGIALLVAGVIVQLSPQLSASRGAYSYSSEQGVPLEVVLINVAYAVSPPMITVGFATIVGLIFMAALAHRSRSDEP